MEFFMPCWIALGMMFADKPSQTYVNKQSKTFASRLAVCNRVATLAEKEDLDPILAIAIAFNESRFSSKPSPKGAQGPLGVIPKYHCEDIDTCDYTKAGISALRKFLDVNGHDYCSALAQFNRGLEGKCEPGRSEYAYARYVLSIYEDICAKTGMCETC